MIKPFSNRDLYAICESYRMIYEDASSKNRHYGREYTRKNASDLLGRTMPDGHALSEWDVEKDIAGACKNAMEMAKSKFMLGVTRIYLDSARKNPQEATRILNRLNQIIKIIASAHESEYDRNLNGMTFDELEERFGKAVYVEQEKDRESLGANSYTRNADYDIVRINSFEEASRYGQYTSWCVTHSENMFDTYTGGMALFYFCLKKGFESTPRQRGEGCPLDEYGLSMIAVLVNEDGSLKHCTCRWNHDNGGNDNIMDTRQLSELLGVNFYDVFRPRDAEEVYEEYRKYAVKDPFAKRMGWLMVEDSERGYGYDYIVMEERNGRRFVKKYLEGYRKSGLLCLVGDRLYWYNSSTGERIAPPERISGNLDCSRWPALVSLEGCPKVIGGSLDCSECPHLKDISEAPHSASSVNFYGCDSLDANDFKALSDRPSVVKSMVFDGNSTFSMKNGRATALLDLDDIKDVYHTGRDSLSWDFAKSMLAGEGWPFFEPGEMPGLESLPDGDFDAKLSGYGVTWKDIARIYEGEYDEVGDPDTLTEVKCEKIRALISDDFYDGLGVYNVWWDCQLNGMEDEAYEHISSEIFPELHLDRKYGVQDSKVKVDIGQEEIQRCLMAASTTDTTGVLKLLRTDEDGFIEPVMVYEPYYGFNKFDDALWTEAVNGFADNVIKIMETNEPPPDVPGQMTFDFG